MVRFVGQDLNELAARPYFGHMSRLLTALVKLVGLRERALGKKMSSYRAQLSLGE